MSDLRAIIGLLVFIALGVWFCFAYLASIASKLDDIRKAVKR